MERVASGDRSSMLGMSGAADCAPVVCRRARSCGARLAWGTRMGIPRWLPDGIVLDDTVLDDTVLDDTVLDDSGLDDSVLDNKGSIPGRSSAGGRLAPPAAS